MPRLPLPALLALACASAALEPQDAPPRVPVPDALRPVRSVELPRVEGRIDHLAVDPARGRAFVAALGNDSLEVVDLEAGVHRGSIAGLSEPQGVVYLADVDRIVVANGGNGA